VPPGRLPLATALEPAERSEEVEHLVKLINSMVGWVGDTPFYVAGKGKFEQMPPYLMARLRKFRRERRKVRL
jgi:hypothetical protein